MTRPNQVPNRLLVGAAAIGVAGVCLAVIVGAANGDGDRATVAPESTSTSESDSSTTTRFPSTSVVTTTAPASSGSAPSTGPGGPTPSTAAVTPTTRRCTPAIGGARNIEVTIDLDQTQVQRGTIINARATFSNPHDEYVAVTIMSGWGYWSAIPGYVGLENARVPLTARPDLRHFATCVEAFNYYFAPHSSITASGTLDTTNFPPGTYPTHAAVDRGFPTEDFGGPGGTFTVLAAPTTTTADPPAAASGP